MRPIARPGRVLWLAALALAACAAPRPGAGVLGAPLAGTEWRLEELNGQPALVPPGGGPTLAFEAGESRVSGTGGCNQFSGPYTQDEFSLRIGPLVATRRACVDDALNRQEAAYLRALESTTRYYATAERLMLYAGDRLVARLWRSTGLAPP